MDNGHTAAQNPVELAFTKWERARETWLNHPATDVRPGTSGYDYAYNVQLGLCRKSEEAFDEALRTPSPDIRGVVKKLAVYLSEYGECIEDDGRLSLILDDARRLAEEA